MRDARETGEAAEARVERLWEELSLSLRTWLERRTGDPHVAEDLLMECFLRVHDRLDEMREEERPAAWVWRIARNLVVDWRRRVAREAGKSAADEALAAPDGDPAAFPEGEDAAVASWLVPAIGELEETDREVLELTELAGLTQRDAADRLGLSLPAVKSRVLRGRARLRERILACCALEFDRRGGIVAYRERSSNCCRT